MSDAERFRLTVQAMADVAIGTIASFYAVDDAGHQGSWSRDTGFWFGEKGQHPRRGDDA